MRREEKTHLLETMTAALAESPPSHKKEKRLLYISPVMSGGDRSSLLSAGYLSPLVSVCLTQQSRRCISSVSEQATLVQSL